MEVYTTVDEALARRTDRLVAEIRVYAGNILNHDRTNGSAAVILGLVANLEEAIAAERGQS